MAETASATVCPKIVPIGVLLQCTYVLRLCVYVNHIPVLDKDRVWEAALCTWAHLRGCVWMETVSYLFSSHLVCVVGFAHVSLACVWGEGYVLDVVEVCV